MDSIYDSSGSRIGFQRWYLRKASTMRHPCAEDQRAAWKHHLQSGPDWSISTDAGQRPVSLCATTTTKMQGWVPTAMSSTYRLLPPFRGSTAVSYLLQGPVIVRTILGERLVPTEGWTNPVLPQHETISCSIAIISHDRLLDQSLSAWTEP